MKIKLIVKDCVSCGICMDVCLPGAIDMRIHKGNTVEGNSLIYQMMTYPFMDKPELCNSCMICVNECPTSAIEISNNYINPVIYQQRNII
jgi:ferredoxin